MAKVVELLRGGVFFLHEKHQLRVEQEAALFWQVSRGPLDRENVKAPEQGDSLTWGNEAMPVLLRPCSLIALHASL